MLKRNVNLSLMLVSILALLLLTQCTTVTAPPATTDGEGGQVDEVTLRTNWLYSGIHAWVFYGKEQGFFRDEGIILDIREGNGTGNVIRTVVSKADDFAMVSVAPPIISISQGSPIRFIYTWLGGSSWGYMCHPDSGIQDAKDLEGKIIVSSPGNAGLPLHPVFIAQAGLDASAMQDLTLVDAAAMVTTVLSRNADCELGGLADHIPLWRQEGVEPVVIALNDYGIGGVSTAVITHQDTVEQNPDLVGRMARAMQRSQIACGQNVDDCVNALLAHHPFKDFATEKMALEISMDVWLSPNQQCPGQFATADWEAAYQLLKDAPDSAIEEDIPLEEFYLTQFLPGCPE